MSCCFLFANVILFIYFFVALFPSDMSSSDDFTDRMDTTSSDICSISSFESSEDQRLAVKYKKMMQRKKKAKLKKMKEKLEKEKKQKKK